MALTNLLRHRSGLAAILLAAGVLFSAGQNLFAQVGVTTFKQCHVAIRENPDGLLVTDRFWCKTTDRCCVCYDEFDQKVGCCKPAGTSDEDCSLS